MKRGGISGGILEAELGSPWTPPARCSDRCPEVERAADAGDRLRALLARALELVPADHPIVREALKELE